MYPAVESWQWHSYHCQMVVLVGSSLVLWHGLWTSKWAVGCAGIHQLIGKARSPCAPGRPSCSKHGRVAQRNTSVIWGACQEKEPIHRSSASLIAKDRTCGTERPALESRKRFQISCSISKIGGLVDMGSFSMSGARQWQFSCGSCEYWFQPNFRLLVHIYGSSWAPSKRLAVPQPGIDMLAGSFGPFGLLNYMPSPLASPFN